jgi:FkbM family methyltransferase
VSVGNRLEAARWRGVVMVSRWRHRLGYLVRAPAVYRNWWAMGLSKLGVNVTLELRDGSRYFVRAHTTDLAVVNEVAFINPYLQGGQVDIGPNATVVDVGANIGDFTVQAARLCPQGRVIAVEPLVSAGAMIGTQARLNGLSNVTWIRAQLSGTAGQSAVHQTDGLYGSNDANQGARILTLPNLVAELGLERIDLLKLDCEGAEWDILPASESILPRVRQICMEYHREGDWTPERLSRWLTDLGFTVTFQPGAWNGLLWARRWDRGSRCPASEV